MDYEPDNPVQGYFVNKFNLPSQESLGFAKGCIAILERFAPLMHPEIEEHFLKEAQKFRTRFNLVDWKI